MLLAKNSSETSVVFQQLDRELMNDFTRDHSLLRQKSKHWEENARRVKSGCTALVIDINLDTLEASYANAGDCRLLVCGPQLTIHLVTTDLNAKNVSERQRLASEHPNEDQMLVANRLFGRLMTTRGTSL